VAGGEEFEAFIFAWISFNGWATCCCNKEVDNHWLQMMMLDSRLTRKFASLMKDSDFRDAAQTFRSLWPIFRVSQLPEGVRRDRPRHGGRKAVTDHYQDHCPEAERAPDCHLTHTSLIEPDWAHTLEALYRVRNNLFHGQKSSAGHEDHMIVKAAVGVMVPIAAGVLTLQ
jgi:hypothetical protein